MAQAQRMIKGTVTDKSGAPVIGANVVAKGTTTGTITDLNGNYSLNVPSGANAVMISYIGFNTQEINLGASNMLDVTMEEGVILQEAVITALGISRQEKALGYGLSRVSGSEVKGSGEVNVIQSLASKASGVQVIGSSGTPGASSKILIRGNSTFTGNNQPLIIIDGIPYDNSTNSSVAGDYPFNPNLNGVNNSNRALDMNPGDIESVNILKGVAAATLYGTRAANGAIIITTKKGRMGQKGLDINLSSSIDFSQVNNLPELQSIYGQGNGGGRFVTGTTDVKVEGTKAGGTPNSWGAKIPDGQSFNNFDNYFESGSVTFDNSLSISGGSDKAAYRFSLGNTNQDGIVPNTFLNRNSFSANINSVLNKITLGGTFNYSNSRGNKAQNGSNLSGVMLALTRMPADFDILGGTADNGYENLDGSQHSYFPIYDNPLWSAYHNTFKDDISRFTGGVNAKYSPYSWMDIGIQLSLDNYTDYRRQIFDILANDTPEPIGEIWENTKTHTGLNGGLVLSFRPNIFDEIKTDINIGNDLTYRNDQDHFARGRGLGVPGFFNLSNASDYYTNAAVSTRKIAGLFADINLSYKDFLFVGLAGRNDYASTFGKEKRDKGNFYPSASVSLVFSELLNNPGFLNYGKIRFSYGKAGIEPIPYSTKTYFTQPFFTDGFTDGNSFPYLGQNGFGYSTTLGDPNLEPEILEGIDVGFDLKMFNSRVNLGFTYYIKNSSNLLLYRPIASSSGFDFIYSNAGEMENKGIEIDLGVEVLKFKNFNWNLNLNFSKNTNEVLQLAPGVNELSIETAFSSIGSFAIVGQPYGAFFGTKWDRTPDGKLIVLANGRPKVAAETGNLGNPYPDWIAGLRNTFTFFGFTASALLDVREGGSLWGGTIARLNRIGRTQGSADDRGKSFIVDGVVLQTDGTYKQNTTPIDAFTYYSVVLGDGGGSATENAVYDGSWIRLREVSLAYDFKFNNNKYINGARLFVTGRNLWLKTDYPGVDPETSLTGAGSNINGFDYFNFPNMKSFLFGVNLNF